MLFIRSCALLLAFFIMGANVFAAQPAQISVWPVDSLTKVFPNDVGGGPKVTVKGVPVPLRLTVCVDPTVGASSVMVKTADAGPTFFGVNVKSNSQFAPAETVAPQVVV